MQGLAAVEATAEGDEDGSVGSPHSCPGWAGPAERVLYFYQAPGPDPAHYHQGSSGPSRPGWEGRREGGRRRGAGREGGRRRGVGQSASPDTEAEGKGDGDGNTNREKKRERRRAGEK